MTERDDVDLDQVRRDIAACVASQDALVAHLRSLDAVDPAAPSLLPDWTIGHVLTHIARNADGVLRMLDGLAQYWNGVESRNADIAMGAGRGWGALVDDVAATADAVAARLREVGDWTGIARTVVEDRPKWRVAQLRRREVEVHRADLGLGYGFGDMPNDFVRAEIRVLEGLWAARRPMGLTHLPETVLDVPEHQRLAWLFGRAEIAGVPPAGVY